MARRSTPEERANSTQKSVKRIRRKYKVNLNTRKKYILGEKEHVKDMVVVLKLSGYSNNQIGQAVGVSRGQVKSLLEEPDISERLEKLRKDLPEAALELLHGYTIEAVQAIVDVMRATQDDGLILKAASEILDRAGVAKVSKSEGSVHRTNENKTTFSTDGDVLEALRTLPPEKQEEAAQMMENVENFLKEAAKEDKT